MGTSLMYKIIYENYLDDLLDDEEDLYSDDYDCLDYYDDNEFLMRFRMSKEAFLYVLKEIQDDLEYKSNRNHPTPPVKQLLVALRYYATGFIQANATDEIVPTSTASRLVNRVNKALAKLQGKFITFPETESELLKVAEENCVYSGVKNCIGVVGSIHVPLFSQIGGNRELFLNSQGFYSWHVQVITNASLECMNIFVSPPGNHKDSAIFENSLINTKLKERKFRDFHILGGHQYARTPSITSPSESVATEEESIYSKAHTQMLNCVDRFFTGVKRRFPVLESGLRLELNNSLNVILSTFVLNNILVMLDEEEPPIDPDLEISMNNKGKMNVSRQGGEN